MDLETSFVGNPVAISERRCSRRVISGHIMDGWKWKGAEGGGNKLAAGRRVLVVVGVLGTALVRASDFGRKVVVSARQMNLRADQSCLERKQR